MDLMTGLLFFFDITLMIRIKKVSNADFPMVSMVFLDTRGVCLSLTSSFEFRFEFNLFH